MKVHALTVCVNYADHLAASIARWVAELDGLAVVTTASDTATIALCHQHGASVVTTDAFTRDGAVFNKGAAIAEAFVLPPDWCLFFDADILPPEGWRDALAGIVPGNLYGCRRVQLLPNGGREPVPPEPVGIGFFQLFHQSDPNARRIPIVQTCWRHAGVYDSEFFHRWPRAVELPLTVDHLGEREQWWGRGNAEDMQAMRDRRRVSPATNLPAGYCVWDHERL